MRAIEAVGRDLGYADGAMAAPTLLPDPRTMDGLRARHDQILAIAAEHGASNVRVIGSVARGEAQATSDVDLYVDLEDRGEGFAYYQRLLELRRALSRLLRCKVDVIPASDQSTNPVLHRLARRDA